MKARIATPLLFTLLAACGGGGKVVTVVLDTPTLPEIDPGAVEARLARIRVWAKDSGGGTVAKDLAPSEAQVVFEDYRTDEDNLTVLVEGYDELGTIVAFGRVEEVDATGDAVSVTVPFRRSLAYVIHQADPALSRPESVIYVVDVASRAYVTKLAIPGTAPVARGISARGGEAMLVTFSDMGDGKLGILSTKDHTWTVFPLPVIQDLTIGVSRTNKGLVAGGGRVHVIDFSTGVTEAFKDGASDLEVGGRVRDAVIGLGGRRAVVALDTNLAIFDLETKASRAVALEAPGGVGLNSDGQVAFATSRTLPVVVEITLEQQVTRSVSGAFDVGSTGLATYSDAIPAVLALNTDQESGASRVYGWEDGGIKLPAKESFQVFRFATGITTDGPGRRVVVVSAGSTAETAGLSIIDTYSNQRPIEGSSVLYPLDPDDTSLGALPDNAARYRPRGVAVIYGR